MKNNTFKPQLNILPTAQKTLWPELKEVPETFTLYGGTAIALQLGHRKSVDFDFFGADEFDPDTLLNALSFLKGGHIIQRQNNTLTVVVDRGGQVFLSFFGLPELKPIKPPLLAQDTQVKVASLLDLAGMKVSVVQKRAEWKDYFDIATLIKSGISLQLALSAGQAIYREQFNPQITLKALSYFDDVLGLTEDIKHYLQHAVQGVDLGTLPELRAQYET